MKKIISILCSALLILSSFSIVLPIYALTDVSIEEYVEELSELYLDETEMNKTVEESANSRLIVKASRNLETYGDAKLVQGTDDIYIFQFNDNTSACNALEYYQSLSYVEWAEIDGTAESQSLSYGTDMLGTDEAKEYITSNNISTSEINIALIDSGINFKKKTFIDSGRVIDSGVNLSGTGTGNSAQQDAGKYHGSNITSILLDNTTDNVNIIGYKVTNSSGKASISSVATAIDIAVDKGADVINLSLGAYGTSELLKESIENATDNGVIVVAAAGNESDDVENYIPSSYEEVFTVGAIDNRGNYAYFSNFGEEVDFVAPGYNVELWGNKTTECDYDSGTSFSAPYITAVAAMTLSINPQLTINEVKEKMIDSCVAYEDLIYDSLYLDDIDIPEGNLFYGINGIAESENLYYGNGMPQLQHIVGCENTCNSPMFSIEPGIYHDAFELSMLADGECEIYYTLDGSYPSKNRGIKYSEPIQIDSTSSIRAIAYGDNCIKSLPSSNEYKIEYYADEEDFTIDNRGYITGYNGIGKNGNYIEIVVPNTINGITVRGVAQEAFFDETDVEDILEFGEKYLHLRGITLPNTVVEIEDYAFFNVYSLKYFTAPGLKTVGNKALYAPIVYLDAPNIETIGVLGLSTNLSSLNLLDLKFADKSCFEDSKFLKEVQFSSLLNVPERCFYGCSRLETVILPTAKSIDDAAFMNCYFLSTINVPEVETLISTSSSTHGPNSGTNISLFSNCNSLQNIELPELTEMDSPFCFYSCDRLTNVDLPNLINIDEASFYECYSLINVNIPKAETIGKQAFNNTTSLKNIDLISAIEIKTEAFLNSGIEVLNAPNLQTIGSRVFAGYSDVFTNGYFANSNLKSVSVPNLMIIEDYAFAYTSGLTEVNLPSVTTIGENAFYESLVNYLEVPCLQVAHSLPTVHNSTIVTSEIFEDCTEDTLGRNYVVYGVKDSYAHRWAEQNEHTFIAISENETCLSPMTSQIRFTRNDDGSYANMFDVRTRAMITDEDFKTYIADTNDEAELIISKVGFVYSRNATTFSTEDAKKVAQGETVSGYTDAPVNYIQDADGYYMFTCIVTNIPIKDVGESVTAYAYICINDEWYFFDAEVTADFNQLYSKNYPLAAEAYGWEI